MQRINETYTLEVSYLYSYASRIYGQDHTGYRTVLFGCQPSLVKAFKLELWKDVDQFVICTLYIPRQSRLCAYLPFSRICLFGRPPSINVGFKASPAAYIAFFFLWTVMFRLTALYCAKLI